MLNSLQNVTIFAAIEFSYNGIKRVDFPVPLYQSYLAFFSLSRNLRDLCETFGVIEMQRLSREFLCSCFDFTCHLELKNDGWGSVSSVSVFTNYSIFFHFHFVGGTGGSVRPSCGRCGPHQAQSSCHSGPLHVLQSRSVGRHQPNRAPLLISRPTF